MTPSPVCKFQELHVTLKFQTLTQHRPRPTSILAHYRQGLALS